ncbi:DUF6415 family natural product biosynthesis protein [Streptomyces sp. NPDC002526]
MTTAVVRRQPLRDGSIQKAVLVGDRAILKRYVDGLRNSLATDLVALSRVEDDIDVVLSEHAPATDCVIPLSLRLRSAVGQLVDTAMRETNHQPTGDVANAILRGCHALAEALPTEADEGLGHLRRLALAAQDILDQDVISDDVLDRAALLASKDEA